MGDIAKGVASTLLHAKKKCTKKYIYIYYGTVPVIKKKVLA